MHPDEPTRLGRRPRRLPVGARFALTWHATSLVTGLLVAIAISIVEPFDLDRAIGEQGRLIFYKVAGFFYPETRSPKTLVVTIDQRTLDEAREVWPIPYAMHAGAIDAIVAGRPRALFIDLAFIDARLDPALAYLLGRIDEASRRTQVYLAASTATLSPQNLHARPEIDAFVRAHPNVHFVSVRTGTDLGRGSGYLVASDVAGLRPAAVGIYEDLQACGRVCHPNRDGQEMDIWWAAPRKAQFNCTRTPPYAGCEQLKQNGFQRGFWLMMNSFGQLVPQAWRAIDPLPAPYSPTISLAELFDGDLADRIGPVLTGAVVFYGADLPMEGDRDESTIQGTLPGIQAHAMAYDNLVALNGRYVTLAPPFGLGRKAHAALALALLTLAAFIARATVTLRRPAARLQPHLQQRRFGAIDATVFSIGVVLLCLLEFFILRVGPATWAPILFAAFAADVIAARPLVGSLVIVPLRRARTAALAKGRRKPRWRA